MFFQAGPDTSHKLAGHSRDNQVGLCHNVVVVGFEDNCLRELVARKEFSVFSGCRSFIELFGIIAPYLRGDIFLCQEHRQNGAHCAVADYRNVFEHSHRGIIATENTEDTENFSANPAQPPKATKISTNKKPPHWGAKLKFCEPCVFEVKGSGVAGVEGNGNYGIFAHIGEVLDGADAEFSVDDNIATMKRNCGFRIRSLDFARDDAARRLSIVDFKLGPLFRTKKAALGDDAARRFGEVEAEFEEELGGDCAE